MDANYASHTAPSYNAATANILILEGGINDIYNAGTQSSINTSIRSYSAKARATGFKIYVMTLTPVMPGAYGWGSSLETIRQAVNTDRRTNWAAYCDGLIDVDSNSTISDPTNRTYYLTDGLHWTSKTNDIVADMVQAAVGVASAPSGTGTSTIQEEQARLTIQRFKGIYLKCLSDEAIKVLSRNMSSSDFEIYIKGRCLDEANLLRITMADYWGFKHPDSAAAARINSADWAISEAIANITKFYAGFTTK